MMSSFQIVLKTVATTIDLLVAAIVLLSVKDNKPRIGFIAVCMANLVAIWF